MKDVESTTITEYFMGKITSILNNMGGLINPWLWGAIFLIILI